MENHENKILIDWISFTSKIDSVSSFIDLLGLSKLSFTLCNGAQGYRSRVSFDGINIHYDHRINEGVWVEMSGKGCRAFETHSDVDFFYLFFIILSEPESYHLTRLDVAYDCFDDTIPINTFFNDIRRGNFVTRFDSRKGVHYEGHPHDEGLSLYFGSMKSDIRFRCYDKAHERGYMPDDPDYFSWVRFEIQLRDDRALAFIRQLDEDNVGTLFRGVVSNYLRIVVPSDDSNRSRWKTKKWWSRFTEDVEKIRLFTKCDSDYNLAKCEDFVYHHCGNALDTLLSIKGLETFFKELKKYKPDRSERYTKLINDNGGKTIDYISEFEKTKRR